MHLRSTLLTFLLALGLGGYYVAVELPRDPSAIGASAGERLLTLETDQITRLVIRRPGAPELVVEREPGALWEISAPVRARADLSQVQRIYQALHARRILTSWQPASGERAAFGFEPPRLVVVLSDGTTTHELRFGEPAPGGQRRYVMRDDDPRVHLVPRMVFDAFDTDAEQLRDRRLLRLRDAEARARAIAVTRGDATWTLTYRRDRWLLDGGERVDGVLGGQIANFLNCRYETARPLLPTAVEATLRLQLAGMDSPLEMRVSALDGNHYWVWGPADTRQYKLPRLHLDPLLAGPDGMISRELLHGRAGANHIVRVELRRDAAGTLDPPLGLTVNEYKVLTPEDPDRLPAYSATRTTGLMKLLDRRAIARVLVPVASEADLKAYGLAPASTVLAVRKRWLRGATEFTAWCALHIGRDADGLTAIRIEGWPEEGSFRPGIYGVDRALGQRLRAGRLALRDTKLIYGKAVVERARKLSLARRDSPTIVVERAGDRWLAGEGVDRTAAARQLVEIAAAIRVAGFLPPDATFTDAQLDAPDYRLTLTLAATETAPEETVTLVARYRTDPAPSRSWLGVEGGPIGWFSGRKVARFPKGVVSFFDELYAALTAD